MKFVYDDKKYLVVFISVLVTSIFAGDLLLPLGVAGGVPYIAPVFLSYWLKKRQSIIIVATICSSLTLLGFFHSPPGNEMWMVYVNRSLALFAIWITAISLAKHKLSEGELRKTKEFLDTTFTSLDDAVLVVNLSSRKIISCNRAMENIFGYSSEELIGKSTEFLHVSHDMFVKFGMEMDSSLNKKGVYKAEFPLKKKNGGVFWTEHTVSKVKDNLNQRINVVSVIRDISERKKAEYLLKIRTAELESANKELEEFNYIVTHDLKEPLRTLSNYTEILRRSYRQNLDQKALQSMQFINDAAKRMRQMVNDLLQLSNVGRLEMDMQAVDLTECVFKVASDLEALVREVDGKLKWKTLPTVTGDATMLSMVLQNLIQNAIKFRSDRTPEVTVSGRIINGKCEVTVADNGIGIDKEYYYYIFEPFKRLHSRGKYDGSGIGLSICRKIIDLHGGNIIVESEKGMGSKFTLVLNQSTTICRKDLEDGTSSKKRNFYDSFGGRRTSGSKAYTNGV